MDKLKWPEKKVAERDGQRKRKRGKRLANVMKRL
jgi:hypothetical protein